MFSIQVYKEEVWKRGPRKKWSQQQRECNSNGRCEQKIAVPHTTIHYLLLSIQWFMSKGISFVSPAKSQQTVAGGRRRRLNLVSVCNYLVTGLRQFHESGPELKRTISGHLNEILDPVEPGTRRRNHPFFGGGDDSHHSPRKNIAFFAGAGPAIVQVNDENIINYSTQNIFITPSDLDNV